MNGDWLTEQPGTYDMLHFLLTFVCVCVCVCEREKSDIQ